jgi:RecA/RadA recombinase
VSKIGIGFCFAPMFHSSMKHAAPARKELGVPTIFNILGPLSNPAKPKAAAIGVARKELLPLVSEVLLNQGKEGFVFRGYDGLDEVSLSGPTTVYQIQDGNINVEIFDPAEIGIARSEIHELLGGDAEFNASITAKIFAGESGAGKSYICSGNIVKNAQEQGIFVILVDTENALDESWLHALGVDTDPSKLLKLNMSMIDDVAKAISTFMIDYKALPDEERMKVLWVIDSLGMLLTPTDVNQFEAGDMKGDMGRKPKALTALVRNCVNMFGSHNVGLVATNHTYASQDMFDPDDKISGGQGFIYASSIVVAMKKMKLKEDEDGNKVSEVNGIRAGCKVMKTRYAKPFEGMQVKIPYSTGMSPHSGLVDLAEKKGMLKKEGNSLVFTTTDGEIIKQFRKKWEANENGCLDKLMADFANQKETVSTEETATEE